MHSFIFYLWKDFFNDKKRFANFLLFFLKDEEEDAEAARIRESRLKAYAEKKSKKVGPIARSSILLDIKPWSDETDHKLIEMEGLTWAACKY